MNQTTTKQFRILSIALSRLGLGFAVLEGEKSLIETSVRSARKGDKNSLCLAKAEKLIAFYQPDILVLQDVMAKDSRRAPRIKMLHRQITKLAGKRKLKVTLLSEKHLRNLLLGDTKGTKHEMAEKLAKDFPNELALRLPPKRKPWKSEDGRMDIFDAVALAVAFRMA
jgi:hypothetical protein